MIEQKSRKRKWLYLSMTALTLMGYGAEAGTVFAAKLNSPSISVKTEKKGILNLTEWIVENGTDENEKILTDYIGSDKDVVIPLSGDLNCQTVKITKTALRKAAEAANSLGGTLATSHNDVSGKGLIADNSGDDNPADKTVDYSGTFKDLSKIEKVDMPELTIVASDGKKGKDSVFDKSEDTQFPVRGEDGEDGENINISQLFSGDTSLKEVNVNKLVKRAGNGGDGGNAEVKQNTNDSSGETKGGNGGAAGDLSTANLFENCTSLIEINADSLRETLPTKGGNGGNATGGAGLYDKNAGVIKRDGGAAIGGDGFNGGSALGGSVESDPNNEVGGNSFGGDATGGNAYGGRGGDAIGGYTKCNNANVRAGDATGGISYGGNGGNATGGDLIADGYVQGVRAGNAFGGKGIANGDIGGHGGNATGGNVTGGPLEAMLQVYGGNATSGDGTIAPGIATAGKSGNNADLTGEAKSGNVVPSMTLENQSEDIKNLYNKYVGTVDKSNMYCPLSIDNQVRTIEVDEPYTVTDDIAILRNPQTGEDITDKEKENVTFAVKNSEDQTVDSNNFVNTVGIYKVIYSYNGVTATKNVNVVNKTVSQLALEVKDSTLIKGSTWNPVDNIVKALDKDGNDVRSDVAKNVVGTVDTNKVGSYEVTYNNGSLSEKATITVKEEQAPIEQYTVSFKSSAGGTLTGNTTVKVDKGTKITTLPTVKADSGY
ncbi:bacterial Ig-like domain-containing protein, partial [Enterococcus avium]|uniref:bacterial Ig-like domain-containing protein n=1 Tax=Enterococcus avium TaxID=33945 RepID=UPI001F56E2F9